MEGDSRVANLCSSKKINVIYVCTELAMFTKWSDINKPRLRRQV